MVSIFHSEPMQHVSLFMRFDDAAMVSVVLAKSGYFDPSKANSASGLSSHGSLPEKQGISYRRVFNHSLSDWQKISQYLSIDPSPQVKEILSINKPKLVEIGNRLKDIWKICAQHKEQRRLLEQQLNSLKHLFKLLDHFSSLDVNLNLLKRDFKFLDVRLGVIPLVYLSRLKEALGIEGYYLSVYLQEMDSVHIIVAGLKQTTESIQSLLESASFQRLYIPDEFHEHPKKVYSTLEQQQQTLLEKISTLENELQLLKKQFSQEIIDLGELLTLAEPYAILSQEILRKGQLTEINGWIPSSKIALIQTKLEQYVNNPVVLQAREPKLEEYTQTPSYLSRPKWLNPFLHLVTNYGTPRYREFDPSWFFTLTYVLMFGIMFGDVGHGICIIGLAWLLKKKWPDYFSFFLSIGLSSTLFGFIYGSIFAYEHIVPALWMSPIEHPMLMLKLSLLWGASFIVILNVISIYNHLIALQLKDALFTSRGVSGLLLYIAILWSLFDLSRNQFSNLNMLFISIPLLVIFSHQWAKNTSHIAERFLVSLIEIYDVIISYFSNTISFLRVAAFTLNHGALAIALFTLAAMNDGAGHWATIIAGNLFILILEGAIVAIQVLRLEYYEGFSRFFAADGYLFKPMELSPQKLKPINLGIKL
ncbi:MAG: V-type ATPase 116kDa subunit family protein [Pseudomonadota bacterium]